MTSSWYKECPRCSLGGGGRLFIYEDATNRRLYLHCDECEWGWLHPEQVAAPDAGFLTLNETSDAHPATPEAIERFGWSHYALHSAEC
jgi:hypothetical protein